MERILPKGCVYIKLKEEWMGHKRWSVLVMIRDKAEEMQERNVAKILTQEEADKEFEKLDEKNKKQEDINMKKQKSESDKMIKDSINK